MGGKSLFGYIVHPLTAYLDFDPLAIIAHQSDVQCLVSVSFGVAHPVAQTVGMRFIDFGDRNINIETVVQFLIHVAWFENDPYSQKIINLFERNMFGLHLVPDRVDGLHTCQDSIF